MYFDAVAVNSCPAGHEKVSLFLDLAADRERRGQRSLHGVDLGHRGHDELAGLGARLVTPRVVDQLGLGVDHSELQSALVR